MGQASGVGPGVALVDIHGACGCEGDCGGHQGRDDVGEAPAEPFADVLVGIAVGATFTQKTDVSFCIYVSYRVCLFSQGWFVKFWWTYASWTRPSTLRSSGDVPTPMRMLAARLSP